ncbi:DUF3820 family protein [Oceanisphaera avium]|uniref:Cytoplasmic protein n=1 Tax=Oceanisphaera avium TaxID=1903694 RepID=A0A1Y0D0G1_9GAMM|nr:DUF3820 family protein [Oceanisphaera avium]ART81068.1 hypothetical protein CBP12_02380 [Oceanisphaera avium]
MSLDTSNLLRIINKPMPFGKYSGRALLALPLNYLCWLERQGWPKGDLGAELALIYELKHNGVAEPLYALLRR